MGAPSRGTELALHQTKPQLWSLVGAAATRPRNSALLAFLSLLGLIMITSNLPLSGVAAMTGGVFAYGLLVLRDLFNPQLIREVHGLETTRPALPPATPELPLELVAEPHRHLVADIRETRASLRARRRADAIPGLLERCTELAAKSDALARRGVGLFEYLSSHPAADAEADLEHLEAQLATTGDSRARQALETTAATRRGHLESLEKLQQMFDRVTAELAMIASWLQLVETRLVELDARETDLDAPTSDLQDLSDQLAAELAGFQAIDELCEPSGPDRETRVDPRNAVLPALAEVP